MSNFRFRLPAGSHPGAFAFVLAATISSAAHAQDASPAGMSTPAAVERTLEGAAKSIGALGAEGAARLSKVTDFKDSLPNAEPSVTPSERRDMQEAQKRIRMLQLQLQEAELAMKLVDTLRPMDEAEEIEATAEEAVVPASAPATSAHSEPEPLPVVASISGSRGDLTATVLVPYVGEVSAKPGDVLPNGMKVVSVTAFGVVVSDGGRKVTLGFGNTVPRSRMQSADYLPAFQ